MNFESVEYTGRNTLVKDLRKYILYMLWEDGG